MKLGIGITTFPWPAEQIGPVVSGIAIAADEAGVDSLWVMDHFFQMEAPQMGVTWKEPMLDSYTALSYMVAVTKHARLGAMVGFVDDEAA